MLKKIFSAVLGMALVFSAAGCSQTSRTSSKGLKVVCATAPLYDWTKNITEGTDSTDLSLIIGNGTDLHSFQPSASDIISIKSADVLIYVGGESDGWIRDALKETVNKNQQVVCLMDVLKDSVVEEEVVEGMHGEDEEEGEGEEEGPEYDEHVWMSLRLTRKSCKAIEEALEKVSSKDAAKYKANLESYDAKLSALDKQYEEMVKGARLNTMIVPDRYPFRYLAEDYKLKYSAAFVGCSAESEASFETIMFLAGKVDENSLTSVITIEGKEHKIAETIISNTATKDQKILTLDSMQTTTMADVKNGITYISVMESNYEVLKEALK